MSTTAPIPGQPWQPAPPAQHYTPTVDPYAQPAQPAPHGSFLRRWPTWAQNTALIVGAVAVLVVVFFAGFFTANAVDSGRPGIGTGQDFNPGQFGNGFGGNGFGGQSGSGPGSGSSGGFSSGSGS